MDRDYLKFVLHVMVKPTFYGDLVWRHRLHFNRVVQLRKTILKWTSIMVPFLTYAVINIRYFLKGGSPLILQHWLWPLLVFFGSWYGLSWFFKAITPEPYPTGGIQPQ